MPINSKGLIDASILRLLLFFPSPCFFLFRFLLSFTVHWLSYTTIFVSTRARDNDHDIRFSNLFINARDGAISGYARVTPCREKCVLRHISHPETDRLLTRIMSRVKVIETSPTILAPWSHKRSTYIKHFIENKELNKKIDLRLKRMIWEKRIQDSERFIFCLFVRRKKIIIRKKNYTPEKFRRTPEPKTFFSRTIAGLCHSFVSLKLRRVAPNDRIKENEKCLQDSWCGKAGITSKRQSFAGRNYKRNVSEEEDPGA